MVPSTALLAAESVTGRSVPSIGLPVAGWVIGNLVPSTAHRGILVVQRFLDWRQGLGPDSVPALAAMHGVN